jgi:FtsP/CotA-like multicopper oxidase with cupredoxin domain
MGILRIARPILSGWVFFFTLLGSNGARAADVPPFDPASTPAAPCGTGTPAPGHTPPDFRAAPEGLTLTVRQDHDRLCYVFNGSADAPIIRVRAGSELNITLKNEITDPKAIDAVTGPGKLTVATAPVPATPGFYSVVPGMKHHATGATNLHLHGFAVPPTKPQDEVLTLCTDPASGPAHCGQRSFTYRFKIPDAMNEGLYWYHPHVHGEVQAQMLMGLTGALIVEGPQDDARREAGIPERVLIVRQTQDLDAGRTQAAAMIAASPHAARASKESMPALAVDTAHELLCGSNSGIDAISLNGTAVPVGEAPDTALAMYTMHAGKRELWRILNAATDAFLDLSLVTDEGKLLPLTVIARDGAALSDDAGGALSPIATTASQFVPPAGRIEVMVDPPPAGTKAYLVTHAVDTGCAGDRLPERRLALVAADATEAASAAVQPNSPLARRTFFSGLLARPTDRRRVIAMAEYPRPGMSDQVDFYIAERKPGTALRPYHMGDAPAITVRGDTTEEWVVENWTNELHAFHIHQVHFRVLEVDGKPLSDPPLLDVVNVPYAEATGYHSKEGPVRPGRVKIKLFFPGSLAGDIPFHCHLVDHEDNGMMAVLRVLPVHGFGATR